MHFILADDGVTPVPADVATKALWRIEHPPTEAPALMQRTDVDGAEVATVFVGLGGSVAGRPPMLWVTSVAGGLLDGAQWAYASAEAAERGHEVAVEAARRCAG